MDADRFANSPIGKLVPISGFDARFNEEYDHVAFVAEPLPETVELDNQTWNRVTEAMLKLGRLDDATIRFPNPNLLVRPALRREAVSTSALEGTITDIEEVLAADLEEKAALPPDLREVLNAVAASEFGVDAINAGRPLSTHLACELQEILIRGTPTEGPDTGRLRTTNVFIGREDQRVPETRFIPSPHGPLLETGFREWEKWNNADSQLPLLVRTALAHYQFETIHPFHDRNGRVGRILAVLQLVAGRALHHPNLAISDWLENHDDDYRDGLATVSETGEFAPWVEFFARAVGEQAEREYQRVDRLLTLRHELVDRVRDARLRGVAVQIAEDLIGFPFIRVPDVSDRYAVSFETANRAVGKLLGAEILAQVGEQTYDRVFMAPDVVRALRE